MFEVQSPDGQVLQAHVPSDVTPGNTFSLSYATAEACSILGPRMFCNRLGIDEKWPCEDMAHVLEYTILSLEESPDAANVWAVLRELMQSMPIPVLSSADQMAVVKAKVRKTNMDEAEAAALHQLTQLGEMQYETSTVLGWPIKLELPASGEGMVGLARWDASASLANYLSRVLGAPGPHVRLQLQGVNVLELGSGRGELGIALAKHGVNMTLTDDHHLVVRTLRRNAEANGLKGSPNIHIRQLDWEKQLAFALPPELNFVIGSEIIYSEGGEDTCSSLLAILTKLTSLPAAKDATIIILYRHRLSSVFSNFLTLFHPHFTIRVEQDRQDTPGPSTPHVLTQWELDELQISGGCPDKTGDYTGRECDYTLSLKRRS
jgi:predicted nicotinamide N-methyase